MQKGSDRLDAFDLNTEIDFTAEDDDDNDEDGDDDDDGDSSDSEISGGRLGIFVERGDTDSDSANDSRLSEPRRSAVSRNGDTDDTPAVDLDTLRNRNLTQPSRSRGGRPVRQVFLDMNAITVSDDET